MQKYLLKIMDFINHYYILRIIFDVVKRFLQNDAMLRARGLTYTTLFALVPAVTVFLYVISGIDSLAPVRSKIMNAVYANILPSTAFKLQDYLNDFASSANQLTFMGGVFLFVTCLMTLTQVEENFNFIWRVKVQRKGWNWFRHYWTLLTLGPVSIAGVFVLLSAISSYQLYPSIQHILLEANVTGYTINSNFWLDIASYLISVFAFSFLFWGMPNRDVPLISALIAGIVTGTGFTLLKLLFGTFFQNFTSYELIYGAFAAFPLILIWLYTFWLIVLFGVELSYRLTFDGQQRTGKNYHPTLELLSILKLLQTAQAEGSEIDPRQVVRNLGYDGAELWHQYAKKLVDANFIQETMSHDFVLTRDLSKVSFYQFLAETGSTLPEMVTLDDLPQNIRSQKLVDQIHNLSSFSKDAFKMPIEEAFSV